MAELLVIVPSRGRPENIRRLIDAWQQTTCGRRPHTDLLVVVDYDDPDRERYSVHGVTIGRASVRVVPRLRLGGTLNAITAEAAQVVCDYKAIGFLGDDHVPRTPCWDGYIVDALDEMGSGIAYGNDLLQGEKLPTAAFMTGDIIRTLGWMVPPGLVHLYIDDAWRELGRAMDRLKYLPDVVIEHMHPDAGKAPRDAGYDEVNSRERDQADKAVFQEWMRTRLPAAVAKLRAAGLC